MTYEMLEKLALMSPDMNQHQKLLMFVLRLQGALEEAGQKHPEAARAAEAIAALRQESA